MTRLSQRLSPAQVATGLLLALLGTVGLTPTSQVGDGHLPRWESNLESESAVLLLDLLDDLDAATRDAFLASLPGEPSLNSIYSEAQGLYRLETTPETARALARELQDHPLLDRVELESTYSIFGVGTPNDPLYPFQWNFEQINLEGAWQHADGEGVVVAVIDTGVAFADSDDQHFVQVRDLAGTAFVPGYDFVDDDNRPFDEHGHGTHVAGTIAQTTGNGYGVAGIAPGARIMPIRVLDASGRGNTADIAESIRWAADNGAQVINLSLGGPSPSRILQDAITYAHRKGVVVVAAAGNNGWSMPSYPASYNHVISVAATQYDRTTTFYSNWGRSIDIAAPGGNVRVDQNDDGRPDGIMQETLVAGDPSRHEFALYMGTSMASPHVAGVAALLVGLGVTNPDRVEAILESSASRNVPSYKQDRFGAGLLDAEKAVATVHSRYRSPRAALALLFLGFAALGARRKGLRSVSWGAAGLTALWTAAGLSPLAALAGTVGLAGWIPSSLAASPLEAIATSGTLPGILALALLSAGPVLLGVAFLGAARQRVLAGALIGFIFGAGTLLLSGALTQPFDVPLIPGFGLFDQLWLAGNGLLALVIGGAAIRRN